MAKLYKLTSLPNKFSKKPTYYFLFLLCLTLSEYAVAAQITPINQIISINAAKNTEINNFGLIAGPGMNASGQADGIGSIWNNGIITRIPSGFGGSYSTPHAVSDDGKVIGSATNTGNLESQSFVYQNGTMSALWGKGEAYGINASGQIVGTGWVPKNGTPYMRAFSWQSGVSTPLPDLGHYLDNVAYDVNSTGQIVGTIGIPPSSLKFVMWQNASSYTDLGLPSLPINPYPVYINDAGQVAGTLSPSPGFPTAFFWQTGAWQSLVPQTPSTVVQGINNNSQVIGSYWDSAATNASVPFLWQNGKITNLNKLPNTMYPTGGFTWTLAINNPGQILVQTSNLATYQITLPPSFTSKSDDTTSSDETLSGADDSPSDPTKSKCLGMCGYDAHTSTVSLSLNDTPVGYKSSVGPSVYVRLTYSHRTNSQPASPNFFNVGPKWTLNVLSYVQDDPVNAGKTVSRYAASGGLIDYESELGVYNGTTGYFPQEAKTLAKLVRIPASGALTRYELRFPDGALHTYSKLDGATTFPRRVFLTEIKDPQGNALTLTYDTQLRLTQIADTVGRLTTFTYGNANTKLVTRITDPFNRSADLTYVSGKLSSIRDVLGITSKFTYDTVDTTLIKTLETPYGLSNFSAGEDTTLQSRWLELTDALGNTERLERRPNAPSISSIETLVPNGIRVVNGEYNQRNTFYWDRYVLPIARPTPPAIDYTKAEITHWLNNPFGQQSGIKEAVKQPLENRTFLFYAGNDYPNYVATNKIPLQVAKVLDDGTTRVSQSSAIQGNEWGAPSAVYDPLNRQTSFTYSGTWGTDLAEVWQKTSSSTSTRIKFFQYNTQHRPTSYTDASNRIYTYGYNARGQLTAEQNPLLQYTQYAYDAYGRPTTVTNTNNVVVRQYNYPCATSTTGLVNCNLPDWIKDFDGVDTTGYQRSFIYDKLDRVTKITYPDGTTEKFDYNFPTGWITNGTNYAGTPSLHVWQYTDRMGRVNTSSYDRLGRQLSNTETVTIAGATTTRTTSFAYYPNGTLKELTDANGNVTHWDIDLQSRPTAKTYAYGTAAAKTESYAYDSVGRLRTVTDALGQVKTITYNKDDSVASYTYTKPVTNPPLPDTANVSFTYDQYWPRLATMTDMSGLNGTTGQPASATTTFTYTPLGVDGALQLQTENNNGYYNQNTGFFYDPLGRLAQRWAAESQESFGYDALGRLTTYGTDLGSFTIGYLGQSGLPTSRSVTNGTVTLSQTYGYDTTANDRRLKTITANTSAVRSYTYGYGYTENSVAKTDLYNIRTIAEAATGHPLGAQSWVYGYDQGDRLMSAAATAVAGSGASSYGTYSWGYDKLDNAKPITYPTTEFGGYTDNPTYNGLNQQTQNAWWQNFTYDAAGNITREYNETNTTLRQYSYDMEGRLLTMGNGTAGYEVRFFYDGMGRRILQKTTSGGTTTYKRYLWCGQTLCQQRDTGTNSLRRYLATGEYVNASGGNPAKKYVYFQDHLGSVRDLVDATTGARVGALDYKPYGAVKASTGVLPDFQYAGLLWVPEIGLNASATRFYDPGTTRWMTADWIDEAGGVNRYAYGANPIMGRDPLGLAVESADRNINGRPRYLVGTLVHSALAAQLRDIGYDANVSFGGEFGGGRPDAISKLNKLIWELKPESWSEQPKYNKAKSQMHRYCSPDDVSNGYLPGNSVELLKDLCGNGQWCPLDVPLLGDNVSVTIRPDTNPQSGLLFYSVQVYEAATQAAPQISSIPGSVPIIVPLPRPIIIP